MSRLLPLYFLVLMCVQAACQSLADSTNALIQQTILTTRKAQINGYPFISYTPETELSAGVGGIITFYTSTVHFLRPSKFVVSGYYSSKGQYAFNVQPFFYFAENNLFVASTINYGYYIDKFWGIGNETPEIDHPNYSSNQWKINLEIQFPPLQKLVGNNKGGIIYDYVRMSRIDLAHHPLFNDSLYCGSGGGTSSGLGFAWVWDSRDHIFFPNHGVNSRLRVFFYGPRFGSDYFFRRIEIDIRNYTAIAPDHVFAFQVYGHMVTGDVPFYQLADIGGYQVMRGYYKGRFRDANALAAQIEYRQYFWKRLGFVAFAGFGRTAEHVHELGLNGLKLSYGGGLRFKFNNAEKVNLRADVGFGKNSTGIYFGLEEAF